MFLVVLSKMMRDISESLCIPYMPLCQLKWEKAVVKDLLEKHLQAGTS